MTALTGFARWWALSLIATGLDLYDALPKPRARTRQVLHWAADDTD